MKLHLVLGLCLGLSAREMGKMLPWPPLAHRHFPQHLIPSSRTSSHTPFRLRADRNFVCQIIMFRKRFGRQLSDAQGTMSAASTPLLSSYVACEVEACISKPRLLLVFFPLSAVTNCALSHVLFFSCRHFSHAFLDHLWKPSSPSYLLCFVLGFLWTPCFVK